MILPPKKILVAQTLFLGDVILSLPLIARLKEKYPQTTIDVLVRDGTDEAVKNQQSIDAVIVYDKRRDGKGIKGILAMAKRLEKRRYDVAIIFPGSIRTALAIYIAGIPRRIGTNHGTGIDLFSEKIIFPRNAWRIPGGKFIRLCEKFWHMAGGRHSFVSTFFTDVVQLDPARNALGRNDQLLEPLGIPLRVTTGYVPLTPSTNDVNNAARFLGAKNEETVIAVSPGSSWKTKQWLKENYIDVIRRLIGMQIRVVLAGGAGDEELCRNIAETVNSKFLLNTCGKFSILESSAMFRMCKLLLTNDSAAMHIAASMGVPCVIILGPTVNEFGFVPDHSQHTIVEVNGLWCRPCTPFGGDLCPSGTFDCMKSITADMVFEAIMKKIHSP